MILRLLTLSKVDPLPVLNYAHNCNTPLLSLISMMMMIMTMMTIRMMMMMIMLKKYVDFSTRDVVVQKLNFFCLVSNPIQNTPNIGPSTGYMGAVYTCDCKYCAGPLDLQLHLHYP